MATIRDEPEDFHRFAEMRIASGAAPQSLDELFIEWHDQRDREAIDAVILRGLEDIEHGRCQTAEELNRSLNLCGKF